MEGDNKFETFECESINGVTPIEQTFALHYETQNIRGWPKLMIEVWKVDNYGRHNIFGYGILSIPMATGQYNM